MTLSEKIKSGWGGIKTQYKERQRKERVIRDAEENAYQKARLLQAVKVGKVKARHEANVRIKAITQQRKESNPFAGAFDNFGGGFMTAPVTRSSYRTKTKVRPLRTKKHTKKKTVHRRSRPRKETGWHYEFGDW